MRIVHTADWQIGKVFRRFGERAALFDEARLVAIEAVGHLACREGAEHVLVAGDVYDLESPRPATRLAPLERMRRFPGVTWHLFPGNHDPHRPKGLWDQVAGCELPANVRPRLEPVPVEIEPGVFLLPAPLTRKSDRRDVTEWMGAAATPPGAIRIGLAHGSVLDFSGDGGGEAKNPIDPRRADKAGLAYLALGDWHRTQEIGPRVWYAGTPEPDRMGSQEVGTALLVEISGAAAPPSIRPLPVGRYRWIRRSAALRDERGLEDVEHELRRLDNLSCVVLELALEGTLSLAARPRLEAMLERIEASVCHLDVDRTALRTRPSLDDLEAIDFDGVLRRVAQTFRARLEDPRLGERDQRVTEDALVRLHGFVEDCLRERRS